MTTTMTDYRYRKLRNLVKTAKVPEPVKELLFCTLRDYRKERSIPATGTFGTPRPGQEPRCLIGAAVHNVGIYNKLSSDEQADYIWEEMANRAFGVSIKSCNAIINGFDNGYGRHSGRTARLAARLARELDA